MTVAARHTKILIDEFDFSGDSNVFAVETSIATLDVTGFQADAIRQIPGLPGGMISHGGYYTGADAGDIETEMQSRQGDAGSAYVAVLLGTNMAGCPAYIVPTTWGQMLKHNMPFDGILTLNGEWPAAAGMRRGLRLRDATIVATGAGASVDLGAGGTAGGTLYLFVQATNGENVAVAVEHSANGSTGWTAKATGEIDNEGVVVVAFSGSINRYVRINVTSLGTATSVQLIAILAVTDVTE